MFIHLAGKEWLNVKQIGRLTVFPNSKNQLNQGHFFFPHIYQESEYNRQSKTKTNAFSSEPIYTEKINGKKVFLGGTRLSIIKWLNVNNQKVIGCQLLK